MGLQQGARLVPGQDSYLPCLPVWDSSLQQASPTHPEQLKEMYRH